MFDYKYGIKTSEKSFPPTLFLRRVLDPPSEYRTLLNIFTFLDPLEIIRTCSLINHRFHNATWRFELWKNISASLGHSERLQILESQAEAAVEKHFKKAKNNSFKILNETELCLIEYNPTPDYKQAIQYKIVFASLFFKTCSECGVPEKKLRYLPLLSKTLCFNCTKLEKYAMLSQETAELNYGITSKDLNLYKVPGLKVPNQYTPGKPMFVYYEKDIAAIWEKKTSSATFSEENLSFAAENRKTQLIHCLKEEGVNDMEYIKRCVETQGAIGFQFVQGKSRQGAKKIAQSLKKKWEKNRGMEDIERDNGRNRGSVRKKDKDTIVLKKGDKKQSEIEGNSKDRKYNKSLDIIEISDEDNSIANDEPKITKKPKLVLTPQQKSQRKQELIQRLSLMGVPEHKIGLDDPTSLANAFIEGRTKEFLGPIAGAIWRENKPVFTGISFRTTQRLSDL